MRQPLRAAAVTSVALAGLLLGTLDGSAARKPPLPQQNPKGTIAALAMDGSRIAYDVSWANSAKARCNTIYVWSTRRRAATRVSGRQTCGADNTSTGAGVRELALAGGRAAWIVNQGGNSESGDHLYVSSVAHPGERVLASAFRTGDVSGVLTGNWIGGLVGSGSFLAVDHWATDSHGSVTSAHLERIGARLANLAEGTDTMRAESTDGRQVAVLRENGTIGLYSTGGALLRTVTTRKPATEVALRGDYLAVLTSAETLEVYNSHSGRLLHSWRTAHSARSLDVSSGLATYAAPFPSGSYARIVHVRRLLSGRDRVLATTPPEILAVRLEPAGLAYAFNRVVPGRAGTVVFVPMSRVVRAARGF
jgi:hypothetical protein